MKGLQVSHPLPRRLSRLLQEDNHLPLWRHRWLTVAVVSFLHASAFLLIRDWDSHGLVHTGTLVIGTATWFWRLRGAVVSTILLVGASVLALHLQGVEWSRFLVGSDAWEMAFAFVVAAGVGYLRGALLRVRQESTHARQAAADLDVSTRTFRSMLDSVGDTLFTLDTEGRYTSVFGGGLRTLGIAPEHLLGVLSADIFAEEHRAGRVEAIREALAGRNAAHEWSMGENVFHTLLSPIRDDAGAVIGIVGVGRNVTELHRIGRQVEQSEARFRMITDLAPVGIMLARVSDGTVLYASQRMAELLGTTHDALMQATTTQFYDDPNERAVVMEALRRTGEIRGLLVRVRKSNGTQATFSASYRIIELAGESVVVAIAEDFTDRAAAEEQLRIAKEAAEEANRHKSEFLNRMSHDLRTPMNAVLGFAQMLLDDPTLGDRQHQRVERILSAGGHLLDLINEVLDMSRIEVGKLSVSPENVAVAPVVEEVVATTSPLAEARQIRVTNRVVDASLIVVADRTRLRQVLMNLMSNAIKYSGEGSDVTLRAEKTDDGSRVRIAVADTGPGIPEDQHETIFRPFERLAHSNRGIEGTGIGLTLSRALVGLMEGTLTLESVVGEGSTFTVELPAGSARDVIESFTPDMAEAPRRTILYIDDNPDSLHLMEDVLSERPHIELLTAPQASIGIEFARVRQPDLIILDINMPDMDGYAALAALRASEDTRHIPVVALTASAHEHDIQQGREAGFRHYFTKPMDVRRFHAVIDSILETDVPPEEALS